MHAIYGHEQKPEYEGLKKERIAVLCSNESGILKDDVTKGISHTLRMAIAGRLKKATVIPQSETERWLHDSPSPDEAVRHVGKGTNADVVILVKIQDLKLLDGQTMYRGVSDIDVQLYDVEKDQIVFEKMLPDFTYPQAAAISTTEMETGRFQKLYVMIVGDRVSRMFVAHPMGAEIAEDARILEFQ